MYFMFDFLCRPCLAAQYEVVIYGGTSAAVVAAVQAKRLGKSVVIVCPDKHLGGLSSGGLGFTDTGNKSVIGGLSRDFYHRIWTRYQNAETWKWQRKDEYGNKGQGTAAIDGEQRTMWIFEPHVAEDVFESYVKDYKLEIHRDHWLDRASGVTKQNGRIQSIRTLNGSLFEGRMFIDATYEGDLMAAAGVAYSIGRESNQVYGEKWNGNQVGVLHHRHHFGAAKKPISPFRIADDPTSGLLPRIHSDPPGVRGEGDRRIQAYCYRMCLTDHPPNRIAFAKPDDYDANQYELLLRVLNAGWRETFEKFDPIPNHKTDTNNHGPFSTDNIGMNYDYPEGSYEQRHEIALEHRRYQQGLMYFLANDSRVPEDVRTAMADWGLAADEFRDNGHWPHQMYIREARRMIGKFVMTENELVKNRPTPESIGMGSYTIDSHNVRRYVTAEGHVQNEGDIGVSTNGPYEISLGSILPRQDQCENLLVPVCVSSSHIAFGSIRMEPVFMILGQSASTVAAMAIDKQCSVQEVPYPMLRERLLQDGQVLESKAEPMAKGASSIDIKQLAGTVVDDSQAQWTGDWTFSSASRPYVGAGYRHNGNEKAGIHKAVFETALAVSGMYDVRVAYSQNANRATNVPISIEHVDGTTSVLIKQNTAPPIDGLFLSVGKYRFEAGRPARVTIACKGTDGYVIADAVQWLKTE
ncbi:MAG: FAD-dependent oxidoreductase [Planctomycetota bacterium]|nr:FAD-dependent oxidoreductase [Planctomycetota bacterium]